MPMRKKPYDLSAVQAATERSVSFVEAAVRRAKAYETDPQKVERVAAKKCIYCFYACGLVSQAPTEWICVRCGREDVHRNTNSPALCLGCATETELCVECAGDIYGRQRKDLP